MIISVCGRNSLVLGGARSGKSTFARLQAEASAKQLVFIATGQAFDAEMAERIAAHKAERGERWRNVELEGDLPDLLARESAPDRVLLIDCLTLWLSRLMFEQCDVGAAIKRLCHALTPLAGSRIFVSNETGCGIVPDTALGRHFRDWQGKLNQKLAEYCSSVIFVAAGMPLCLKPANDLRLDL